MRKLLTVIMGVLLVLPLYPSTPLAASTDYEKYGKIAIAVVQADYPGDDVTDYEYKGRKKMAHNQVEDDFVFLVVENGKEFNVTVTVQHNLSNNKLLSLKVTEQNKK